MVPAAVVVNTLAQLARLPAVDLATEPPSPEVAHLIPISLAQDQRALTLRVVGTQLSWPSPSHPTGRRAVAR